MVPQAFGSLGYAWARNPTRFEGRVMVYLMLMHGAKGMDLSCCLISSTVSLVGTKQLMPHTTVR